MLHEKNLISGMQCNMMMRDASMTNTIKSKKNKRKGGSSSQSSSSSRQVQEYNNM
jgi:hypothetical protein